jgi:transcriptional regulator with PAS, ATPase and Fis domain
VIKTIKTKIRDLLKEKEVSLAMIYDREGRILWNMGRTITGRTINDGEEFCKSYIRQSLDSGSGIDEENVVASLENGLSRSAQRLFVRSVLIQPIDNDYFLYIDSGSKSYFSDMERQMFRMLGDLLGETIQNIRASEVNIDGISGDSPQVRKLRKLLLNYSLEDDPVLLMGETGVGKTHIAELIHKYSGRSGKFVVVDVPTVNENLFESEVFGHKKGSFTGAVADKKGLVAEAADGTLFFDEISEVPVSFQAKLLRFIETKKYRVLGETGEKTADIRILAATNKNLSEAIEKGEFRQDLYYRLNILGIQIPPLRERREDIKTIILENLSFLKGKEVGKGFWDAVGRYDWPGNFRELFSVLKRSGILCDSPITAGDVEAIIHESDERASAPDGGKMDLLQRDIDSGKSFWDSAWQSFLDRDINRQELKEFLKQNYSGCGSRLKTLSEKLNIVESDFKKFVAVLHKYKIHPAK